MKVVFSPETAEMTDLTHAKHKVETRYTESKLYVEEHGTPSTWKSIQFHFHAPSEHTFDGEELDAELHLVFKGKTFANELAVVGLLFRIDENAEPNAFIESLKLEELKPGNSAELGGLSVNLADLYKSLKSSKKYSYMGSLTTPPCTESVKWFVYEEIATITPEQFKTLNRLLNDDHEHGESYGNNRRTIPLGSRTLWYVEDTLDITE